jgi:site-specific DNA recombinase
MPIDSIPYCRSQCYMPLVDENGDGLTPSHARNGERKYRYYVSRNLQAQGSAPSRGSWRLPARELEDRVAAAVREMLDDQASVIEAAQKTDIDSRQIDQVLHAARTWSHRLQSETEQTAALVALVERVELKCDGMGVSIKLPIACTEKSRAQLSDAVAITRSFPMQLKRRGVESRLIVGDHNRSAATVDLPLLKAVARAHRWFEASSSSHSQRRSRAPAGRFEAADFGERNTQPHLPANLFFRPREHDVAQLGCLISRKETAAPWPPFLFFC